MLMVRVKLSDDATVVGLLVDTQLVTTSGPPAVSMNPKGELVQGPGQKGLQGFGVVATDGGFVVGPLAAMQPIFDPEKELADDAPPGAGSGAVEGQRAEAEDVPAELRPGKGRPKAGKGS